MCHLVERTAGGHAAREALDAVLAKVRHSEGVGGDDGHRVRRVDERVVAEDHVAVAVAVKRRGKVDALGLHAVDELLGVRQIRVRVAAVKVLRRHRVHHARRRQAQLVHKDAPRVRARDAVHRVDQHLERRALLLHKCAQLRKVKDALDHLDVVGDRVDHLDAHAVDVDRANRAEVDRTRKVRQAVLAQALGDGEDLVGDALGRRAAVARVVLDAKVGRGSAWVVARGEDDGAGRVALAHDARHGRRRQQRVVADDDVRKPVGRGDAQDHLRRVLDKVAPVAAHDEHLALLGRDRLDHGLHKVLGVVRRLEHGDLLAQAARAGLLVREGRRGHDAHSERRHW
eukprot:Unigene7875_Nuclearia_a/m.24190 Unigene7875_Nuclearia_a/g.24190  ORF Unigene7875_Nuclearia_a/g.24190 Unigene7875_Nuclearia_a/m.24190 type:complete len:342 (-) Unigene7875_Nuclearia_a:41-1066(-)